MVSWAVRFRGWSAPNYWELLPVIPGVRGAEPFAEGHGAAATGGRNASATWYFVHNVSELLTALTTAGFRFIAICTSGYYDLGGGDIDMPQDYTILGQLSPGAWVNRHHSSLDLSSNGVVMHLVSRNGAVDQTGYTGNVDCISVNPTATDVYMVHCDLGWSLDENLSFPRAGLNTATRVTVQDCLNYEACDAGNSLGTLIQEGCTDISLIRYLSAFNKSRNPQADDGSSRIALVNLLAHRTEHSAGASVWGGMHQGTREVLPVLISLLGCVHDTHADDSTFADRFRQQSELAVGSQVFIDDGLDMRLFFDGVQTPEPTVPGDGERWLFTKISRTGLGEELNDLGFDDPGAWTLGSNWQVSGGVASQTSPTASAIQQTPGLLPGITYRIAVTISGQTTGSITPKVAGGAGVAMTGNGRFTQEILGVVDADSDRVIMDADGSWDGTLDDITVTQQKIANGDFASDTLWTKGTNWQIAAGVADQSSPTASILSQTVSTIETRAYRVTFTTAGRTAGSVTPILGGVSGSAISDNAAQEVDIVAGSGTLIEFSADGTWDGSIDLVSIIELDRWEETEDAANPQTLPALLTVLAAAVVKAHLLANCGARPLDRDATTQRIIDEVTSGIHLVDAVDTAIIQDESQVGGYISLDQTTVEHETLMGLEGMNNDADRNAIDPVSGYCFGEIYGFKVRPGLNYGLPQVQRLLN